MLLRDLLYVSEQGHETYYQVDNTPEMLGKKMQLLRKFKDYMYQNLLKMGAQHVSLVWQSTGASRPSQFLPKLYVMLYRE